MKRLEFSKYHPLIHMDGNLAYANNGNVILGYSVHLPEIYSLSEKDFEKLHSSWFQSLKSLPSGCLVHKQDTYHKKEYWLNDENGIHKCVETTKIGRRTTLSRNDE